MSVVQYVIPHNQLREALADARPRLAQQAIDQANANLAEMAGECLEYIDDLLIELETATAPGGGPWCRIRSQAAYQIAVRLIGVASVAGLQDLDDAARSLCQVADGMMEHDRFDREPVRVHVQAMRLLRLPEALGSAKADLIAGLEQVRVRFAVAAAESAGSRNPPPEH